MKRYMKNKDFIPEKFNKKIELNEYKNYNKILTLFLIINLFLMPKTIKSIEEVKKEPIISKESVSNKQNKFNLSNINIWIKSIMKDDIEEAYIVNNNGEITVNDLEKIDELSLNTLIEITEVNLNDNEKYKLGVSLNE